MVRKEWDIGSRPDNPNRIYTSKHIAFGIATIVEVVGKLPTFRDVKVVVLQPEGGIGQDPWGVDIDGSEDHKNLINSYVARIIPKLEKIDHGFERISERERLKKIEERATMIALRARRVFSRLQEKREKKEKN